MAHQAIYRKWRPMVFEDIVGQGHITRTLKNQITSGKIGHAYLFCGTRGTGKTTCAKVLSRAVNCLNNHDGSPCNECEICRGIIDGSILDVVEIDAASNNGVDNIREIRDDVRYVAAEARYTVYIIDEVHMLSGGAFNALLKTLEEPPEHVIFILATTEPQKVPQTILSRCQRFDFKRIKPADIIIRMKEIARGDGFNITEDAYALLARLADGSMRDALSLLERVVSSCGNEVTAENITETLGISTLDSIYAVTDAVISGSVEGVLSVIDRVISDGKDLRTFIDSLVKYFRDLMVLKVSEEAAETLDYSADELAKIKSRCAKLTFEKISHAVSLLSDAQSNAKFIRSPRVIYELALIKLTRPETDSSPEAFEDRLAEVERKLKNAPAAEQVQTIPSKAEVSIERRLDAIEKRLREAPATPAKQETPPPQKKREVSRRIYNPIPQQELHSGNPIVKLARNWNNTARYIVSVVPYLSGFLKNRDITIDADGILILFKREEETTKGIVDKYLPQLKKAFKKATGSDCEVKTVVLEDLDSDNIIDFWELPPAPSDDAKTEEEPSNKYKDPIDDVLENFPEIIERTDGQDFLEFDPDKVGYSQSSFDDKNDKEEFLEAKELPRDDEFE